MDDDLKLWKRIKAGDSLALRELFDRYYYQLQLDAKKVFHNQIEIEEAVSDCFIKIWVKRNEINIVRSLRSYLFLMVRNSLIDIQRKKKGIVHLEELIYKELPDEETLNELDKYAKLYLALEKLPRQRRRILEMAVFESLSYAQIATELSISNNTVKTQIGRAYRFLKEELNPESLQLFFMLRSE